MVYIFFKLKSQIALFQGWKWLPKNFAPDRIQTFQTGEFIGAEKNEHYVLGVQLLFKFISKHPCITKI